MIIDVCATIKKYLTDSESVAISILEEINYDEISYDVLTKELSISKAKLKTVINTIKQKILSENENRGNAPAIDKKRIEYESKKQKLRMGNIEKFKDLSIITCPCCSTSVKLERKAIAFAGYNTSASSGVNEGDDFYDVTYNGYCKSCGVSFTIRTDVNFDKAVNDKAERVAKKVAKQKPIKVDTPIDTPKVDEVVLVPVVEEDVKEDTAKNILTFDKNEVYSKQEVFTPEEIFGF